MPTSKTEAALLALVAAIVTASQVEGSKLPAPVRNGDMLTRLVEASGGQNLEQFVNVLDGERANTDELLGADMIAGGFDIRWRARIEFGAAGGADADREALFDAMRVELWNAIKPQVSGGIPAYLGGAVSSLQLVDMLPQDKSNADGLPGVKATEWLIELQYVSDAPF
ncbi:MAG: hypothetical protein ACK4UO_06205 [Pseudolabrys sp.]